MRPSSAKAKGRRFQQAVRDYLLDAFAEILKPDDIRSTSMGASGDDLLLSPLAKVVLPFSFEMKNVEAPSVGATLRQANARLANDTVPVCVFSRNKVKLPNALVIIPQHLFARLFCGRQFVYDLTQHVLFPTITDVHAACDQITGTNDFTNVAWRIEQHLPNSFNLWLRWTEASSFSSSSSVPALAIQIFSNNDEIAPHVVLPFGQFVRLVKALWSNSIARNHLLRLPPEQPKEKVQEECILIDD